MKTDNPGFEKRLRGVIRKVLGEARAALQKDAQSGLNMKSDPRNAYKAVRFAVYKRLLGGQVNILDSRKTTTGSYDPPKKGLPKRGGNRQVRSERTKSLMEYEGGSRAFVLRFLNQGTRVRYAGYGRNGKTESEYNAFVTRIGGRGKRGSIAARNWFTNASQAQLVRAAEYMESIIDKVIKEEFI